MEYYKSGRKNRTEGDNKDIILLLVCIHLSRMVDISFPFKEENAGSRVQGAEWDQKDGFFDWKNYFKNLETLEIDQLEERLGAYTDKDDKTKACMTCGGSDGKGSPNCFNG